MKLRDKYGWPVERIIGKPVTNFIRLLLHTNLKQTWQSRNPGPATPGDANNLSPTEIRLLNEGLADVRAGRTVPLEQVRGGRFTEPPAEGHEFTSYPDCYICGKSFEEHQPEPSVSPGEQPPRTPLEIHDKGCVQCGNFLANNEGMRCWTGADLLAKEWMASQRAPAPPPVQERESDETQGEARPCSDHKMIQEIWDMLSELTKEKP